MTDAETPARAPFDYPQDDRRTNIVHHRPKPSTDFPSRRPITVPQPIPVPDKPEKQQPIPSKV
jgi:hypothetical protein